MIHRPFWQDFIEKMWEEKNVIWLMGVRRVGKTSLCQSLHDIEYFDCESMTTRNSLENYESFLASKKGKRIILDEIHKLDNPSEVLKIAADYYPDVKIIATGSSTLGVSAKFSDTLTGRKREVWLTPLLLEEMNLFSQPDIAHRFLYGGFPSFFMQSKLPEIDFKEWFDAYWAKDIQELFKVSKKGSFQKFTELLWVNSGGMFDITKYSVVCQLSRETVVTYLQVLEDTFVVHVVRPFSSHKATEIVKSPKVYGFDTGFVCYAKGWGSLRPEDMGFMWEHIVLNQMQAHLQHIPGSIHYWRDKSDHEIDFVVPHRGRDNRVTVVECKFNVSSDDAFIKNIAKNIIAFRQIYPAGENLVVAHNIEHAYSRVYKDITLTFVNSKDLVEHIKLASRRD